MLPISALNTLRRTAVEGLLTSLSSPKTNADPIPSLKMPVQGRKSTPVRSASFTDYRQLTRTALDDFDVCYLPPEQLQQLSHEQFSAAMNHCELGVAVPPIITDGEREAVQAQLQALQRRGIRRALVSNLGHLPLLREIGLSIDGDFRLNVTNTQTVACLEALGIDSLIVSPELTLQQIRDLGGSIRTVVYGRIPLMLLEKCVIREIADCKACDARSAVLTDRRGARFPVLRLPPHRNIIYNSLPTYTADMQDALMRYRVGGWHFIFSIESPSEVDDIIRAYQKGKKAPDSPIRRIGRT